jgi:radical SAM protein with 4Fe4S-binding SPASM domain
MAQAFHFETTPGRPYVFQVELTNFCNLKCPMCPHDLMKRSVGYMDFALFEDIVGQVRSTNPDLRLHNMGESLFHKEIGRFIRHANGNHLETILSSNATTLTEAKIQELIDAQLSWLYVSFDGASAGTYERFRKGAHYEREKAKVERLLQMRNRQGSKFPQVMMSCLSLPGTQSDLEEFRTYWQSRVEAVRIKPADGWDGSSDRINTIVADSQYPVGGSICGWPWQSMVVLWDGRVVPCCYDYDGKYVLGDLRQKSLAQIFNDEPMKELRRLLGEGRAGDVALCRTCPRGGAVSPTLPAAPM